MKIIINLHNVGLGNNGGSRTLIRCAEVLSELGNTVIMCSNHKSKYTWHKIKSEVRVIHSNKVPNGDVIIATGYKSVKSTVRSSIKRKFYYIRGFELWQASEKDLVKSYKSLNCIVNSSCLYDFLAKNKINSKIMFAGLDFDMYYDKHIDRNPVIGGLFHKKHKTKKHDHLIDISNECGFKLEMLGRECKNRPFDEINNFYNRLSAWISTSELEGFHNPPTEAAMAGVPVIANDSARGGTSDYVIPNKTALVYESGNIKEAARCVSSIINDPDLSKRLVCNMQEVLRSKIGDRERCMRRFSDYIGSF